MKGYGGQGDSAAKNRKPKNAADSLEWDSLNGKTAEEKKIVRRPDRVDEKPTGEEGMRTKRRKGRIRTEGNSLRKEGRKDANALSRK